MFDRESNYLSENFDVNKNLPRFENDVYATKYLVGCYNPEFKIRVTFLKNVPPSKLDGVVRLNKRVFNSIKEVF